MLTKDDILYGPKPIELLTETALRVVLIFQFDNLQPRVHDFRTILTSNECTYGYL